MVYLRAGWSLGNVPDRYIHAGAGGDQLVGRCISLLPLHDPGFAKLSPHFSLQGLTKIESYGWEKVYPGYNKLPVGFRNVLHVLLANIVYHHDWLKDKLHINHPLWQMSLISQHYEFFRSLSADVHTGVNLNPHTNVSATGIPGHLSIVSKVDRLEQQVRELQESSQRAQAANAQVSKLTFRKQSVIFHHWFETCFTRTSMAWDLKF